MRLIFILLCLLLFNVSFSQQNDSLFLLDELVIYKSKSSSRWIKVGKKGKKQNRVYHGLKINDYFISSYKASKKIKVIGVRFFLKNLKLFDNCFELKPVLLKDSTIIDDNILEDGTLTCVYFDSLLKSYVLSVSFGKSIDLNIGDKFYFGLQLLDTKKLLQNDIYYISALFVDNFNQERTMISNSSSISENFGENIYFELKVEK